MMTMIMRLLKMTFGYVVMLTIVAAVWSCKSAPVVGTLTAYYAKEDLELYQQGELIFDTNNPYFTLTDFDEENYKLKGILYDEDTFLKIPKSKVEVKTYTMNELAVSEIEDNGYFKSEKGRVAKIFMSDINGHKYFHDMGIEEIPGETANNSKCYVLSVQLYGDRVGRFLFEEQLSEKEGFLKLYDDYPDLTDMGAPEDYTKKEGKCGYMQEDWVNADWDNDRSAYDKDGKLMVDQWFAGRIPNYISIAYIDELEALYVNGQLYHKSQKDDNPDYAALVREQLPSVETFVNEVDAFQEGTKKFLPTDRVWDNAETDITTELGAKGFKVKRDKKRVFFISAAKNCEFKADEVDYVYSYSIKPLSSDSIAAACYFEPMGDFYVKGVILLDDPNVYEAYVEQIKEFGYKQTKEEMSESDPKEKYVKDNYYFICDKEKKIIELHYDFMKAQNIGG